MFFFDRSLNLISAGAHIRSIPSLDIIDTVPVYYWFIMSILWLYYINARSKRSAMKLQDYINDEYEAIRNYEIIYKIIHRRTCTFNVPVNM